MPSHQIARVYLNYRPTGTDWVREACLNGSYWWKAVGLEGECRRQREPMQVPLINRKIKEFYIKLRIN